jgi:methyl-accepting chemotaxis protein
MNTVNKLAQHNASSVEELNQSAHSMQEQAQLVLDEVRRFK